MERGEALEQEVEAVLATWPLWIRCLMADLTGRMIYWMAWQMQLFEQSLFLQVFEADAHLWDPDGTLLIRGFAQSSLISVAVVVLVLLAQDDRVLRGWAPLWLVIGYVIGMCVAGPVGLVMAVAVTLALEMSGDLSTIALIYAFIHVSLGWMGLRWMRQPRELHPRLAPHQRGLLMASLPVCVIIALLCNTRVELPHHKSPSEREAWLIKRFGPSYELAAKHRVDRQDESLMSYLGDGLQIWSAPE
jgi:hypothetical protein